MLTEDLSKPFHKTPNDENVIKNQYMQVNNNFSCKFVLANTTKVFVVPKPQLNCTDPQYFSIKPTTYITSSASHELSATSRHDMIGVSMPENGFFCDVIGYFYDYSMSVTPGAVTPALVVKMLDAVDDDNEVVKRLECVTMKGETVSYDYYTESDGSVCDISGRTISEGDVLRVAADETGRVSGNSVDTMYDYKNKKHLRYLNVDYWRADVPGRLVPVNIIGKQDNKYILYDTQTGIIPGDNYTSYSREVIDIGNADVITYDSAKKEYVFSGIDSVRENDSCILYISKQIGTMLLYYK